MTINMAEKFTSVGKLFWKQEGMSSEMTMGHLGEMTQNA